MVSLVRIRVKSVLGHVTAILGDTNDSPEHTAAQGSHGHVAEVLVAQVALETLVAPGGQQCQLLCLSPLTRRSS